MLYSPVTAAGIPKLHYHSVSLSNFEPFLLVSLLSWNIRSATLCNVFFLAYFMSLHQVLRYHREALNDYTFSKHLWQHVIHWAFNHTEEISCAFRQFLLTLHGGKRRQQLSDKDVTTYVTVSQRRRLKAVSIWWQLWVIRGEWSEPVFKKRLTGQSR
jgi:hypothetical protein